MGKLIVIDGVDGSGKGTQTRALEKYLNEKGIKAIRVDFPRYGRESCTFVEGYLHGKLGSRPDDTGAYASSLFYSVDRYWSYRTEDWGREYDAGAVVICDRYTTANAIHQCAKLDKSERDGFLDWLSDTEYEKLGIPRPDKVIFLDMKPEVYENLIESRSLKDDRAKDIHELDRAYLRRCYEGGLYACRKLGWTHITCFEDDKPRKIGDIFDDILDAIRDVLPGIAPAR